MEAMGKSPNPDDMVQVLKDIWREQERTNAILKDAVHQLELIRYLLEKRAG